MLTKIKPQSRWAALVLGVIILGATVTYACSGSSFKTLLVNQLKSELQILQRSSNFTTEASGTVTFTANNLTSSLTIPFSTPTQGWVFVNITGGPIDLDVNAGLVSANGGTLSSSYACVSDYIANVPIAGGSGDRVTVSISACGSNSPQTVAYTVAYLTQPSRTASHTTVTCYPTWMSAHSSNHYTCKAKVTGHLPTGTVSWSQTGTGSVSLSSTACTLSQGRCSVNMTGVTAGMVTLHGTYSGDSNNPGSSGSAQLTITKAHTATTLSCKQSSLGVGANTTCTATVSGGYASPIGTVTFTWREVMGTVGVAFSSTTCTLSSSGSCSVTVTATASGSARIKAAYSGDSNNLGSLGKLVLTID